MGKGTIGVGIPAGRTGADDTLQRPHATATRPQTRGRTNPVTDIQPTPQTPAERELAELLVTSLNIDWLQAEAIDPQAPLFGAGDLGLDSIDALELALAVSKHYGFQLRSDNPDNRQIFGSLRALSGHVEQHRTH